MKISEGNIPTGQSCLLQESESLDSPGHFLPSYCGRGLLHTCVRVLVPPPQVVEQIAQGDHGPQAPSTTRQREYSTNLNIKLSLQRQIINLNCFIKDHTRQISII